MPTRKFMSDFDIYDPGSWNGRKRMSCEAISLGQAINRLYEASLIPVEIVDVFEVYVEKNLNIDYGVGDDECTPQS